jgi:YD repeat-containing protein
MPAASALRRLHVRASRRLVREEIPMMSRFVSFARASRIARVIGAACLVLLCAVASADVTYEYDSAGRLRRVTHDNGMQTTYTLDAAGNRTSVASAMAPGTLQLSAATYSGGEVSGQRTITITATRTGGNNGVVTIPYTVTAGTATAGSDYTASNGTFSWATGDAANKTFTITVLDDTAIESNETLTVALGTATGGATRGTPNTATVTITSDDIPPPGSLQFSAATYTGGESLSQRTITITATRASGSNGAVSASYTVTAGTATAGSDYTASNGTLSWANGDTANKTFTITVLDDTAVESNETVTVTLGSPTGGATIGSPATATVTIFNDDNPPAGSVQFSASSFSGGEAAGQRTITIGVTRTGGNFGGASVPYTITGNNATAGVDYTASNGTLLWSDGDTTTKTFTITVLDDSTVENAELINLALGTPVGASLGSPNTASVAIISDDNPPAGTLQFSQTSYGGAENPSQARTITIVVGRINGSFGAATVQYTVTAGTATAGVDYSAPSSGTLSWANGDATGKAFAITVLDDFLFEAAESVTVTLSAPTGATLGSPSSAPVTIGSDDAQPPAGTLQFSSSSYGGGEASGLRTITVSVTRINGSFGAASVPYTVSAGTATAGSDYSASNGTFNWADGETATKSFAITVLDDSAIESTETASVSLGTPSGATLGSPNTTSVSITSDDNPPAGSVQLSSSSYSGGEPSGQRSIVISATRAGGSFGAASVPYSVSAGTATAGSDYSAGNGTFSWSNGDAATKSFTITVLDDSEVESNETLSVSLGAPSGGVSLGAPTSATVTIASDDNPSGSIQLTSSSYTGGEASGLRTVTITATRTGGSFGAVNAPYHVVSGTAIAGSDFSASDGTLTWSNGDTASKSFTLTILDDPTVDPSETITVYLDIPSGASLGSPSVADVTITDDDVANTITISNMFVTGYGFPNASAFYTLTAAGEIWSSTETGYWLNPRVGMSGYEVKASGSGTVCEGMNWDVWVPLSVNRGWSTSAYDPNGGAYSESCTVSISIRAIANPSVVLAQATISLTATVQ